MKTNSEIYQARKEKNKRYIAYIPKDIAIKFDKKLQDNNIKFSYWLKNNIERYIENL